MPVQRSVKNNETKSRPLRAPRISLPIAVASGPSRASATAPYQVSVINCFSVLALSRIFQQFFNNCVRDAAFSLRAGFVLLIRAVPHNLRQHTRCLLLFSIVLLRDNFLPRQAISSPYTYLCLFFLRCIYILNEHATRDFHADSSLPRKG